MNFYPDTLHWPLKRKITKKNSFIIVFLYKKFDRLFSWIILACGFSGYGSSYDGDQKKEEGSVQCSWFSLSVGCVVLIQIFAIGFQMHFGFTLWCSAGEDALGAVLENLADYMCNRLSTNVQVPVQKVREIYRLLPGVGRGRRDSVLLSTWICYTLRWAASSLIRHQE